MTYSKISTIQGVSVISIAEKENDLWMAKLHTYAEESLRYYVSLLGFYPFSHLVILKGDSDCGGGYPQEDGVIVVHKKPIDSKKVDASWRWIVAHEIGHMYWGFYVLDEYHRMGSKLGWLTKGIGLYLDSLFVADSKLDFPIHQSMVEKFKRAQKSGKSTSFQLSQRQIQAQKFDYNMAIDHGRAFYVISEIATKLGGRDVFVSLCKTLLSEYAKVPLSYEKLVKCVRKSFRKGFIYEVS